MDTVLSRLWFTAARPGSALRNIGGLPSPGAIFARPRLLRTRAPQANPGLPATLGRIGDLEVRLATTRGELVRAQKLRYAVFCEEMSAVPDMVGRLSRRDIDPFDAICDHLLVVDHAAAAARPGSPPRPKVVGTYRLLRQDAAEAHDGFYTAGEFDIAPLLRRHPGRRFLELGRSCVLKPHRDKRTVELLWHGIWTYVLHHRIDVMFGCASLEGTDPSRLALPLSFLHHHALAAPEWRARPVTGRGVVMDRISPEAIDMRGALQSLPPLVKGYLRLGATFGEGAVVDHRFGTTDVLVVLPVEAISPRYIGHFGVDAGRHAA